MWTRRSLGGLALSLTAARQGQAQQTENPAAAPPTTQSADARALRAYAETTHPRGREAAADPVWREGWDDLIARADALDPATYVMSAKARLAWFADGHTTIFIGGVTAPGFDLRLPIGVKPLEDGLFVISAKDDGAPLLGARITAVEGVPAAVLARQFIRDWPGNNPAWGHHDLGLAFLPAILRGSGLTPSKPVDAPVLIEANRDGTPVRSLLSPRVDGAQGREPFARTPSRIESLRPTDTRNFVRLLDDGHTVLIAFDSMSEDLTPTLEFVRQCFTALDNPAVRRVVVDLRRNGGGNNFLGEGLRKYLERSRFNRPGGLYVLIAPQTFSAAQNLATRLERETYAIFVGQPTGGSPNHYGDARPFAGQGYTGLVSTLPWFDSYPADTRRWIMPDILTPDVFADWAAGRDPALEAALAHTTDALPNDLSQTRTFPAVRPGQEAAWTPFWA